MAVPEIRAVESQSPKTWAIAIHGGAGSHPDSWDPAKRDLRKQGLDRALTTGRDMLAAGRTALDTVEAVINVLEDDAMFNAGRGAVLTKEGRAELDASIMDGSTLACGAVAGVTRVKNPITLARRVMSETRHVLLAGPGADQFAEQQQVTLVDPDYFLSRRGTSAPSGLPSEEKPHFGTVGCVVLDADGNLAAGTSTGGTSKKLPGRVGDSPIVGAGTYAANGLCAVSGTGVGEEYIRRSVAFDVAAQMRYAQRPIGNAISEIMTKKLRPGVGGLIAVSSRGEIVLQHNTPGMSCGAADSDGRFETFLLIPEQQEPMPGEFPANPVDAQARQTIEKLLGEQVLAWNAGDIDGFMKAYWNSDALTFSSGGTTTRGYQATLQRYKRRYPTADEMGKLTFGGLEFVSLAPGAMQLLGDWKLLKTNGEAPGGRFTLVLRRFGDDWKIIHDHTSVLPTAVAPTAVAPTAVAPSAVAPSAVAPSEEQ